MNQGQPLISIITVVFNGYTKLEQTIESVIYQTYQNIEYIIIDGGSTDGTIEIIKKYTDRINYWISEPDRGLYDAMNKGIKKANGEWINFMNCGDLLYGNNTISNIFYNSNLKMFDVIYGNTIFDHGHFQVPNKPIKPYNLVNAMSFCHQSSFVKSSLMKKHLFDTKYKICADRNFFMTIHNNARYHYTDDYISIFEAFGMSNYNISNSLTEIKKLLINHGIPISMKIRYEFFKSYIVHYLKKYLGEDYVNAFTIAKGKIFYRLRI